MEVTSFGSPPSSAGQFPAHSRLPRRAAAFLVPGVAVLVGIGPAVVPSGSGALALGAVNLEVPPGPCRRSSTTASPSRRGRRCPWPRPGLWLRDGQVRTSAVVTLGQGVPGSSSRRFRQAARSARQRRSESTHFRPRALAVYDQIKNDSPGVVMVKNSCPSWSVASSTTVPRAGGVKGLCPAPGGRARFCRGRVPPAPYIKLRYAMAFSRQSRRNSPAPLEFPFPQKVIRFCVS